MHPALVLGFAIAVIPLAVTPGASFTLMLANAPNGARAVGGVIVGTALGILTHGTLAAFGLAAIVMRSSEMYRLVRVAGAIYLIVVGIGMFRRAGRQPTSARAHQGPAVGRGPIIRSYLANVLNPKAAGVYLTLAPQFIPVGSVNLASMSILAAVHVVVMALWLGCVGFTLSAVRRRVAVERFLGVVQRAGAVVLMALGVRASVESSA